jgi:hypothetical protein
VNVRCELLALELQTLAGDGAEGGSSKKGTLDELAPAVESGAVSGEIPTRPHNERKAHA